MSGWAESFTIMERAAAYLQCTAYLASTGHFLDLNVSPREALDGQKLGSDEGV